MVILKRLYRSSDSESELDEIFNKPNVLKLLLKDESLPQDKVTLQHDLHGNNNQSYIYFVLSYLMFKEYFVNTRKITNELLSDSFITPKVKRNKPTMISPNFVTPNFVTPIESSGNVPNNVVDIINTYTGYQINFEEWSNVLQAINKSQTPDFPDWTKQKALIPSLPYCWDEIGYRVFDWIKLTSNNINKIPNSGIWVLLDNQYYLASRETSHHDLAYSVYKEEFNFDCWPLCPVLCAGQFQKSILDNNSGTGILLDNKSGHYRPKDTILQELALPFDYMSIKPTETARASM